MSSGAYRNLGRGGAGNYYSKAELEDATKRTEQVIAPSSTYALLCVFYYTEPKTMRATRPNVRNAKDLEAQNRQPGAAAADDTPSTSTQEYSRLGRGGAGNVTLTALMAAATSSSPQPPVSSGQTRQWSGRGGTGNFLGAEQNTGEAERAAEAKETEHRIEEEVKVDVEKGLTPPQKAYMGR